VIPHVDRGVTIQTLADRYCDEQDAITKGSIQVTHIHDFILWDMVVMVLSIYISFGTQRISVA
jgi:hypothetical protein